MRSHGVPDFAEPDSNGNCNHLLNTDTQLSAARTQRTLGQLVKYSRCMRAHGVPDFAEPDSNGNVNVRPGSVSSQETAANQVCNHLLNTDTQLSAARTQRTLGQLVKYLVDAW